MKQVRYCPLGPRQQGPVRYALCSECRLVRKSNRDCPLVISSPTVTADCSISTGQNAADPSHNRSSIALPVTEVND